MFNECKASGNNYYCEKIWCENCWNKMSKSSDLKKQKSFPYFVQSSSLIFSLFPRGLKLPVPHMFLSWVSVAAYPCAHAKIQINMIISLLGTLSACASRFLSREQVSREQFYIWKSSKKTVLLSSWSRKTHLQILVHWMKTQ